MGLTEQIIWGTAFLSLCVILHVVLVSKAVEAVPLVAKKIKFLHSNWHMPVLVGVTLAMVVFSHTVQVWIWAITFMWRDAFSDWSTSVYFSIITYTTLGYGDVTLGPEHRVYASFAAVTGLLSFGLSTAFLVGLVTRVLAVSLTFEKNVPKDK